MEYVEEHVFRWGVYSLMRSALIRSALRGWDGAVSSRSKGEGLRSKVKSQRSKVKGSKPSAIAISYRHQPSLSAIAISHSRQQYLSFSFTSTGNNSHFSIPFLFRQSRRLCNGWFSAYIYNVRRSKGRKREGRVHTCWWPCAHGRRSFFRHSAIGCAYGQ